MELSKGSQTKIRIIEAATDLIFKNGFYGVTFAEIAKTAGISQPGIYNHFKNMDDILIESALYWSAEAKDYIDMGVPRLGSAIDQLKSAVERNLLYPQKNRKQDALFIGLYYYSLSSKKALDAYTQIKASGTLRFHALILQGNRESLWKVKNPESTAYSIHSFLVGEVFKVIIQPHEEKPEQRMQRCWNVILCMLGA